MPVFYIRTARDKRIQMTGSDFAEVRALLIGMEARSNFGRYDVAVKTTDDGPVVRACRECGKPIADWRARCLTCSTVGARR